MPVSMTLLAKTKELKRGISNADQERANAKCDMENKLCNGFASKTPPSTR